MFNFRTYGTTAVVARASGAGQHERAARLAAQALWVSLGIGLLLLVICEALAGPLLRALGADGKSGDYAVTYFRIAAIGLPAALVALGGQGYLRGVSNMRRPKMPRIVTPFHTAYFPKSNDFSGHAGIPSSRICPPFFTIAPASL